MKEVTVEEVDVIQTTKIKTFVKREQFTTNESKFQHLEVSMGKEKVIYIISQSSFYTWV